MSIFTSVYRKLTFFGQGLSFFSHCSVKFKINCIEALLHRAVREGFSFLMKIDSKIRNSVVFLDVPIILTLSSTFVPPICL